MSSRGRTSIARRSTTPPLAPRAGGGASSSSSSSTLNARRNQQNNRNSNGSSRNTTTASRRHPSPIDAGEVVFGQVTAGQVAGGGKAIAAAAAAQVRRGGAGGSRAALELNKLVAPPDVWYQWVLEQRLVQQAEFFNRRLLTMREEAEIELQLARWVLMNRRDEQQRKEELYELEHFRSGQHHHHHHSQQRHQHDGNNNDNDDHHHQQRFDNSTATTAFSSTDEAAAYQQEQQQSVEAMRAVLHRETAALRDTHQSLINDFARKEAAHNEERESWRREAAALREREKDLHRELMSVQRELRGQNMRDVIMRCEQSMNERSAALLQSHEERHRSGYQQQQQQQQQQYQHNAVFNTSNSNNSATTSPPRPPTDSYVRMPPWSASALSAANNYSSDFNSTSHRNRVAAAEGVTFLSPGSTPSPAPRTQRDYRPPQQQQLVAGLSPNTYNSL